MKSWKILLAGLLIVGPIVLTSCAPNALPPGAVFLGKREVNFGIDRDTIGVPHAVGPLHQLIVVARMNPVEVYNIRVIFESGASEDYNLREKLFTARERLIVDLPGNTRRVREVIFRYRSLNNAARRAVVELWGR
jgi:hypothetical protein